MTFFGFRYLKILSFPGEIKPEQFQAVVVYLEPTKGKDNNYECFTQDPDGNLIELMQYTEDALQLKDYPIQ